MSGLGHFSNISIEGHFSAHGMSDRPCREGDRRRVRRYINAGRARDTVMRNGRNGGRNGYRPLRLAPLPEPHRCLVRRPLGRNAIVLSKSTAPGLLLRCTSTIAQWCLQAISAKRKGYFGHQPEAAP